MFAKICMYLPAFIVLRDLRGFYWYSFIVTVDAVYAAAHAIHNIIADICGVDPFYFCAKLDTQQQQHQQPLFGTRLLKYLRNVSFIGSYLTSDRSLFNG